MGLDITAYTNVKLVDPHADWDDWHEEGNLIFLRSGEWPVQADGLVDGVYSYDEEISVGHKSYGLYGSWRRRLCEKVLGKSPEQVWENPQITGPFLDIINFSDCEGFLGPATTLRLSMELVMHPNAFGEASYEDFNTKYADAIHRVAGNGIIHYG